MKNEIDARSYGYQQLQCCHLLCWNLPDYCPTLGVISAQEHEDLSQNQYKTIQKHVDLAHPKDPGFIAIKRLVTRIYIFNILLGVI